MSCLRGPKLFFYPPFVVYKAKGTEWSFLWDETAAGTARYFGIAIVLKGRGWYKKQHSVDVKYI